MEITITMVKSRCKTELSQEVFELTLYSGFYTVSGLIKDSFAVYKEGVLQEFEAKEMFPVEGSYSFTIPSGIKGCQIGLIHKGYHMETIKINE